MNWKDYTIPLLQTAGGGALMATGNVGAGAALAGSGLATGYGIHETDKANKEKAAQDAYNYQMAKADYDRKGMMNWTAPYDRLKEGAPQRPTTSGDANKYEAALGGLQQGLALANVFSDKDTKKTDKKVDKRVASSDTPVQPMGSPAKYDWDRGTAYEVEPSIAELNARNWDYTKRRIV